MQVRKELADSFRAAAAAVGGAEAAQGLLDLASQSLATWQADASPAQGWEQAECALYALNLLLPKLLMQQSQQGRAMGASAAQQAANQALRACLAALEPGAPKLAGTALTLVGGLAPPLAELQLLAGSGGGGEQGGGMSSGWAAELGATLAEVLAALLALLECADPKLSRNAATAVHRLCSSPRLAAGLVGQHGAWVGQLAALYCRGGGLQHAPKGGDDLSREEFMLRALCHLARAAPAAGSAAGEPEAQAAGGLPGLMLQLVRQPAAQAGEALAQLEERQRAAAGGALPLGPAAAAAVERCGAQLEVAAVALESGAPRGDARLLQPALEELLAVAQRALRLVRPSPAPAPHLAPLLRGACHAVAAAASAAPHPAVLGSALSLLGPLLTELRHPCLLDALSAVVGAAAAAAADAAGAATQPTANGASAPAPAVAALLPSLAAALAAALEGAARHAGDPEWEAPALLLGAAAARQIPQLLAPAEPGGTALLRQLLAAVQWGASSYHREVCEATLELAGALLRSSWLAAAGAGQPGEAEGGSAPARLVLWLLLAASGAQPPYMVQPIAQLLHSAWAAAGSDRCGGGAVEGPATGAGAVDTSCLPVWLAAL